MRKLFLSVLQCLLTVSLYAQPVINHYSIGKGGPILLINGGPGWSSYHMKPVAEKLSGMGYEVILYDQRGAGKSKIKADTTTIKFDLMVDDIERIRKEREIDSWVVYGHSFGGMLAMGYAVNYPDKIKKLILSAPGGVDLSFLDYYQTNLNYTLSDQEKEAVRKWSDPEQMQKNPKLANYNIVKNTISSFLYNKQLADSIMSKIDNNTVNMQVSNLVFQDLFNTKYNLKPDLYKITAPTLIIQGRQDALGEENPMTISQLIPNSRLVFLEESAHLMWLDRPEKYYAAIEEFLNKPTGDYRSVNPKEAQQLLSKMKGKKRIESRIRTKEGFSNVQGKATFEENFGAIVESFTLNLAGKKVSGKAYVKYSPLYNRFELVQIDEAAGSSILLNGYWNSDSEKLVFKPIKNYSQWGYRDTQT